MRLHRHTQKHKPSQMSIRATWHWLLGGGRGFPEEFAASGNRPSWMSRVDGKQHRRVRLDRSVEHALGVSTSETGDIVNRQCSPSDGNIMTNNSPIEMNLVCVPIPILRRKVPKSQKYWSVRERVEMTARFPRVVPSPTTRPTLS